MQPKMTHLCLHVESLQDCANFYRKYCQLEIIEDQSEAGEGSVFLAESGRRDMIFQFKSGGRTQKLADNEEKHFGFILESRQAIDEIADMARSDQILSFEPDEYLPGTYLCGVEDPNGNCIEFGFNHPIPPVR